MPQVNTMLQLPGDSQSAPHSGYVQTPSVATAGQSELGAGISLIDGTPMRVATLIVLAVLGLAGLRWAGFRFNVTSG